MDDSRTFSFVESLEELDPGKHVRGTYRIPEAATFPHLLVAEALGQTAAFSAMAKIGFQLRPVAGICSRVELQRAPVAGETLILDANLSRADEEAVTYCAEARVGDEPILTLTDALGPMVPMEDYDDPGAVRARYQELLNEERSPTAFNGVAPFQVANYEVTDGIASAHFAVPTEGSYFADHFPRNPVFPGTLLSAMALDFAQRFFADHISDSVSWNAVEMTDMKLRSFMPPGTELGVFAEVEEQTDDKIVILSRTKKGKRQNSSSRVVFQKT